LPQTTADPKLYARNQLSAPGQKWRAWLPAVFWLGVIALESTDIFSSAHTSSWLYPIFHFLTGVSAADFEVWHAFLRKLGHFVGYFVLSLLLFRAWRATMLLPRALVWSRRWAVIAWLMSTGVAILDEWHQTYLPSRTGTVHDVILDGFAALAAQVALWAWLRRAFHAPTVGNG